MTAFLGVHQNDVAYDGNSEFNFCFEEYEISRRVKRCKLQAIVIRKNSATTFFSYTPSVTNMAMVHVIEDVLAYLKLLLYVPEEIMQIDVTVNCRMFDNL